jgi:hypothetical protein
LSAFDLVDKALDRAKQVAGLVGVVYVLGFLALRARLNALGVSTELALINEHYLAEGATFLAVTVEAVLFPWALLVAILATAMTALEQQLGWQRRAASWVSSRRWAAPTLLAIGWGIGVFEAVLIGGGLEDLGGAVTGGVGGAARVAPYAREVGLSFVAVVTALLVGRGVKEGPARWLKAYLWALAGFQLLVLPMHYGVVGRDPNYPFVQITVRDGAATTRHAGALLLETDKDLVVREERRPIAFRRDDVRVAETLCTINILTAESCPHPPASTEVAHGTPP